MSSSKKGGPSRDGRGHQRQDHNQSNQKRPRIDNQRVVQNNNGSGGERNTSNPYLDQLMHKRTTLNDANDACRFFQVALECGNINPVDLLFRFTNPSQEGKTLIKTAFSLVFGTENVDLNKSAIPFLSFLGREELNKGTSKLCVEEIYIDIFETPGLLRYLEAALFSGRIKDPLPVAWFMLSVTRKVPESRKSPSILKITDLLCTQCLGSQATAQLSTVLRSYILENSDGLLSFAALQAMQPHHDNDFPLDYRLVKIVPSVQEINSSEGTSCMLPVSQLNAPSSQMEYEIDMMDADYVDIGIAEKTTLEEEMKEESQEEAEKVSRVVEKLDRQFRLLREDFIAPMKEEFRKEIDGNNKDRRRIFQNPFVVGIAMEPIPCVLINVAMPQALSGRLKKFDKNKKERANFFDGTGRRVLGKDSVLLFVTQGKVKEVVMVGVVVRRDERNEFCEKPGYLTVGVRFLGESAFDSLKQLTKLLTGERQNRIGDCVFQASAALFAYEPVLKGLQEMVEIPFADELLHGKQPLLLDDALDIPTAIRAKLSSDPSQLAAVKTALLYRVALIQGPPGTGKTFSGVQIAKALIASHSSSNPIRILCLCYTNHALDDFLQSLIEDDVEKDSIVRLGSSPKISEDLKSCCLSNLDEISFNRDQNRRFAQIKECLRLNSELIKNHEWVLTEKMMWGPKWWNTAATFLQNGSTEQRNAWQEFLVPGLSNNSAKGGRGQGKGHVEQFVGKGGKTSGPDYFWIRWCEGKTKDDSGTIPSPSIWALTKEQRRDQLRKWRDEKNEPSLFFLCQAMEGHAKASAELRVLRDETKLPSLLKAMVIGCTLTASAKHRDLLQDACPTVVLIEEAAEILEAHVLTCLSPSVKRLIMIGDHQQLRPKLEHYPLRKESGKGIDFDVSLFERLVTKSSFPASLLNVQHRMRPEISRLIRPVYPSLEDHPSVSNRENLLGVSTNVMFITHTSPEADDADRVALGTGSKVNPHEANMVVEIVRYFLKQGYDSSELVILTPYLGQLMAIKAAMSNAELSVQLGDLDRGEITRLGVDPGGGGNSGGKNQGNSNRQDGKDNKNGADTGKDDNSPSALKDQKESKSGHSGQEESVRVATIDNFQGEESRIVIASLVRSNEEGDIGFLSGRERVTVLLSRARDGLILLGNSNTLRNAKNKRGAALWGGVLDSFGESGLYNSFPAVCQCHGIAPHQALDSAEAFHKWSPDGGCNLYCTAKLPTCPIGHLCPKKCHPQLRKGIDVHKDVLCQVKISEKCQDGHAVYRVCCQLKCQPCREEVRDDCAEGHVRHRQCSSSPLRDNCKTCVKVAEAIKRQEKEESAKTAFLAEQLELADIRRAVMEVAVKEQKASTSLMGMLRRVEKEADLAHADLKRDREDYVLLEKENKVEKCSTNSDINYGSAKRRTHAVEYNQDLVFESDTRLKQPFASAPIRDPIPQQILAQVIVDVDIEGDEESNFQDVGSEDSHDEAIRLPPAVKVNDPVADVSKELKGLMRALKFENWPTLLDMSKSTSGSNDVVIQCARQAAGLLANFKLGDDAAVVRESLIILQRDARRISLWPTGKSINQEGIAALLQLVSAIIEDAVGNAPRIAADHSKEFQRLHSFQSLEGFTFAWADKEANRIIANASVERIIPVSKTNSGRSEALEAWEKMKAKSPIDELMLDIGFEKSPSESIDNLMKLTGLEAVKKAFLKQFSVIGLSFEQGSSGPFNLNTRFEGNPGTGKTTVARLYASFLVEVGVLPDDCVVVETSGAALVSGGVRELKKLLEELKEAKGGVVFVDEAYQLNPKEDKEGRSVLDYILAHAERLKDPEYGSIVWVFAGYEDRMSKLFEHNPGLPSRFPLRFVFEDYTEPELLEIFNATLDRGCEDVIAKPKPEVKKKEVKQTPKAISMSSASSYGGGGYGYRGYGGQQKPDVNDRWGNIWRWDAANYRYCDDFKNITGYGPISPPVGSSGNPLISDIDNSSWLYDERSKIWTSDTGLTRTVYPGKPLPAAAPLPPCLPFTVNDKKWSRIAIRRLASQRGTVGFGNARAIRNLIDTARGRQAERIRIDRDVGGKPDIREFVRDDLLGPFADKVALSKSQAWKTLNAMEGLQEVKEEMNKMLELVMNNAEREDKEQPMQNICLNRIFLGNPGTGKTTLAALYARILGDLGLISKGDVILKNPSDFIGTVLGSSESQTRAILAEAEGSVLVIDEAYLLCSASGTSDPYKSAVIDTIVEQVQNRPGDDRAVVMLGYRKEMEAMFKAANPGLARRFQMENAIEFMDYDDAALIRILRAVAQRDGMAMTSELASFAIQQLAKARALPHFGNAGAVNSLLARARLAMQGRLSSLSPHERSMKGAEGFLKEDFLDRKSKANLERGEEEDFFEGLVGCDSVKKKLEEYRQTIALTKKQGLDPKDLIDFNFVFAGSPGTGKTTVARRMGRMFFSLGLLPCDDVVEISASDLVTGYVGQAGQKTLDVLTKARGKVLFIDEAYQLNPQQGGSYMQEVVDEIVKCLTSEDFKGKMIVILAGYDKDMNAMLSVNQGLRSRFPAKLLFEDFSVELVTELLTLRLAVYDLEVAPDVAKELPSLAAEIRAMPFFANGRDIDTIAKSAFRNYAVRVGGNGEPVIEVCDIRLAMETLLSTKVSLDTSSTGSSVVMPPQEQQKAFNHAIPPTPPVMTIATAAAVATETQREEEEEEGEEEKDTSHELPAPEVTKFTIKLQDLLDQMGLNNQEGVRGLSLLPLDSNEMIRMAEQLSRMLDVSIESAIEMLSDWQHVQAEVQELLEAQEKEKEEAKLMKRKSMIPIWRCAVCGRADLPYMEVCCMWSCRSALYRMLGQSVHRTLRRKGRTVIGYNKEFDNVQKI